MKPGLLNLNKGGVDFLARGAMPNIYGGQTGFFLWGEK